MAALLAFFACFRPSAEPGVDAPHTSQPSSLSALPCRMAVQQRSTRRQGISPGASPRTTPPCSPACKFNLQQQLSDLQKGSKDSPHGVPPMPWNGSTGSSISNSGRPSIDTEGQRMRLPSADMSARASMESRWAVIAPARRTSDATCGRAWRGLDEEPDAIERQLLDIPLHSEAITLAAWDAAAASNEGLNSNSFVDSVGLAMEQLRKQMSTGLVMDGDSPSDAARRLLTRNRAPRSSQDRMSRSGTTRPDVHPEIVPLHLMPTYTSRGSGDLHLHHLGGRPNNNSAPLPAVNRQGSRALATRL